MDMAETPVIGDEKNHLEEIIKPFQRELNQRQKKSEFIKKCIQSIEKNDFFHLDELLKSKQAHEIEEDADLKDCGAIFSRLRAYADKQIDNYQLEFKSGLLQTAEKMGLPLVLDFPDFFVLKGIEGKLDFVNRSTTINQASIKSIDPKRIVQAALNLKRKLYDSPFEPQKFIDSLFACYKEILKEMNLGMGEIVPIRKLYESYVWSLQNKLFFQNMDKGKFKGCSIDQFAVDLWRFFQSDVSAAEGGYQLRFSSGRSKNLWLIDQAGEKRQITHASFVKN